MQTEQNQCFAPSVLFVVMYAMQEASLEDANHVGG